MHKKSIYFVCKMGVVELESNMFESDSYVYYLAIVYFAFGLPFAIFSTIMSFYYFFSWIVVGKEQLRDPAIYCFADGILSLAFGSVGIWLVVYGVANIWLVLIIGWMINIPHVLIAQKIRLKVFQIAPANTDPTIPESHQ